MTRRGFWVAAELSTSLAASLAVLAACASCSSPEPLARESCVVALGSSPRRGPDDAWVTIVEFADFECVFCADAEATIAEVDRARPGLRWVFKHFPLTSIHPHALDASLAAECAHEQGKFWEMHAQLFENQRALDSASLNQYAAAAGLDAPTFSACVESDRAFERVAADFDLGVAIGILGTPAFFINGRLLPGAYPSRDFLEVIDDVRSTALESGVAQAEYYSSIEAQGCNVAD